MPFQMNRYSEKSRIEKIKTVRSAKGEVFYAEIIKEPAQNISMENVEKALKEISAVVEKAWGKFPVSYLENSILHSCHLLILRNKAGVVLGVAPIKKMDIDGRVVYSFGLTAVDPDYQGMGFMKRMHAMLGKRLFLENLMRFKTKLEFVFITPNIRTIGALAKVAEFVYPNPYLVDVKTGKLKRADDKTWLTVKHYLKEAGESYRKLDRNGCVMVGFYDDKPNLVVREKNEIPDKKLRIFAENYLKPGNEVVVRAIVGLRGIFRGNF